VKDMSASKMAIAMYKPFAGKEAALHKLVTLHIPTLREENLITDREPIQLKSSDGTIIEIFEWRSAEATDKAHVLPSVQKIWEAMGEVAAFKTLSDLPESQQPFPNFQPLG
jgi:quinol monooxygenase YgiN